MVATEAGVRSHTGMTFCDKPEKGGKTPTFVAACPALE